MKVAPLVKAIENARQQGDDVAFSLVYAGSQNDPTLEPQLFTDLGIAPPDVYLDAEADSLNVLAGNVMFKFDHYLDTHPTDVVIVVDDLASTMAAAIVTKKRGLRLAHLVAGTRSFDIRMPKEINRLVIDGLSDLLFTAGAGASSIATREGAESHKIYMVGNILMDTLRMNHSRWLRPACLDGVVDGQYLVFTLNRRALLADRQKLFQLLQAVCESAGSLPIVAPLRGKAFEEVQSFGGQFHVVSSLSYLEFGYLTAHARGIITDSGNVAEEATFNNVPCITLNSYTEHQETVRQGTNVLVGEDALLLRQSLSDLVAGRWKQGSLPDRWDGRSAERIVQTLLA
jgi:UDP-N-acetylglucosamine 2-epimerase (non-hydrolysing)